LISCGLAHIYRPPGRLGREETCGPHALRIAVHVNPLYESRV
jgi:hypothetical protein